MTTTTTIDERLYGPPGAELMYLGIDEALDAEDAHTSPGDTIRLEEWTVLPPRRHLPSVDLLLEHLEEHAYDQDVDTDGADYIVDTPELRAQAETFLDAVAGAVRWRQADRHVADHLYRVDGDDDDRSLTYLGRIAIEERRP